ncbi:hypothetical protein BABINDRAFT_9719 [Babjeviella inositovora NRRL Y-12698]|uniref:Uncharacterized protein n=1 Tax=Babjeviella inositovora NRRL Y-12698 TaxID=984486 RepID=A0A1E3QKH6_9ASCO|nr:uncharacterized protein BABINDRAFT_9719 [Babjeviella inositovora NRRL Y-12698]ODQ78118.1 hypothetical protein BABINDRAFT_9719 [Babjeviella inositovora NRRL Y-12698]
MAKPQQRKSRQKSTRRAQDAFQLAEKQANGESSDEDDDRTYRGNSAIVNSRRFTGENDEEAEFEDEELDSDEALGSEDDYDVLSSKFSQTIRDKAKAKKDAKKEARKAGKPLSLDEESDEELYDSVDESEFVSLSEVWDRDEKDLASSKATGQDVVLNDDWESEESESEESEESESNESENDEEEEEDSDSDDLNDSDVDLTSTVAKLSGVTKTRKAKKFLTTVGLEENEFNLPTNGKKLSLKDMMSVVDASTQKEAILIDKEEEKSQALAVPLPKRIQERNERLVAYELSKQEVDKWEDTVKQNRRAEVLQFPMNPEPAVSVPSAFTPNSIHEPLTELEHKVNDLLKESLLLDDKKEQQFEDLATAKIPIEEMKKRQAELRLMRELMFREEKKAKRVKKIKSKAYHRIKKKELAKTQGLVEGSDDSDAEEHDMKRAKERMSLKHKNNSAWAKNLVKSGLSKDKSNRDEMEEMLRQGEKLKAKILGYREGEQSDDNVSDLERDDVSDNEERGGLGKGVMAMDFMKNAEKRERDENTKTLELLRKLEADGDIEGFEKEVDATSRNANQGRRTYTPSAAAARAATNEFNSRVVEETKVDETKSLKNKLSAKFQATPEAGQEAAPIEEKADAANPWMAGGETHQRTSKITVVDKSSSKTLKHGAKIAKKGKRTAAQVASEDALIDMDQTLKIQDPLADDSDEGEAMMFKQKSLIKQAFAGDDVVSEFQAEKKKVIKDEGDQKEDMTLPGWGGWCGGNKKNKKKKVVRTIQGVVQANNRKDKHMKNVIINERVNKKNLKYQSGAVPHGFDNSEQYERSLRMPIGQEWTSRETHQRLTMPRVVVKQGRVIDPLNAPFK